MCKELYVQLTAHSPVLSFIQTMWKAKTKSASTASIYDKYMPGSIYKKS